MNILIAGSTGTFGHELVKQALANGHELVIRDSDLDWTIVRPAATTDGERTGNYRHGFPATAKKPLTENRPRRCRRFHVEPAWRRQLPAHGAGDFIRVK
jgi:putative NADH-flavin reductase